MDPYDNSVLGHEPASHWEPVRRAMGVTRKLANRVDLQAMTPHGEIASTNYCLAEPGKAYIVFVPKGGAVTVDLSKAAGRFLTEWIHPIEGRSTVGKAITGGDQRSLAAPFQGAAVLYLHRE
jgi:hypothetical protein